jgi:hypothetical protein
MRNNITILILLVFSACSKVPEHMKELSCPTVEAKVETRLAQWKPDHEDLRDSFIGMLSTNANISGDWKNSELLSMDDNRMTISFKRDGKYEVLFSTHGCVGFWTLTRQATYSNGILRMNLPIEEYSGSQYDTLYTAVISNQIALIPQSEARNVQSKEERAIFLGFTKNKKETHNK